MTTILKSFLTSVKHWYIPLILGLLFMICGFYIFSVPLETYLTLSILFSVSFIVSGIFEIFFSIQNAKSLNGWGWYLVSGLLSLATGLYLSAYPQISILVLPFVVGFSTLIRSFQLFGYSLDLKDAGIPKWGNLTICSVLSILFSFALLANPLFTGISLVTLTALAFIFVGFASLLLAFNLKKIKDLPQKVSNELKGRIEAIQSDLNKL